MVRNAKRIGGPGSTSDAPLVFDDASEKWVDIARRMT